MATLVPTSARNLICNAFVDSLDDGFVKFETSAGGLIVACNFDSTSAFTAAATGTASANTFLDSVSTATGTIQQVSLYSSANTLMFTTDCNDSSTFSVSSITINSAETMRISTMTLTAPAS